MTVNTWSQTAATNATADASVNAREGMAPSQVNDSMRAMMAAIAKWRDDMSGNLVTGGTSTAYTLTTNQGFTALTDGLMVACRMSAENGTSPTLNVDGLGARSIAGVYGTAIGSGRLKSGSVQQFVYDATDDKWIVHAPPPYDIPSTTVMLFRQTSAPTGWTKDTTYNDAAVRIVSGSVSQQTTAGNEFSTLLTSRTIAQANLPSYTLPDTLTLSGSQSGGLVRNQTEAFGTADFGTNATLVSNMTWTDTTLSLTGSVTSGGSGTAMNFDVNYVDVILAAKD